MNDQPDYIVHSEPIYTLNDSTYMLDCPKHGRTHKLTFAVNDELLGVYCIKCVNDFVQRNVKNYVQLQEKEEKEKEEC